MLNIIWLSMVFLATIVGFLQGRIDLVVHAITDSAKLGFEIALSLAGVMTLWLGIMGVATESGLIKAIAYKLRPLLVRLFPDVPVDHPAMGAIVLNIAANMLGLSNAATPFGITAMKELQRLNTHIHTASNAMCTFLAINTSSIQLIPATAVAFLAANGNSHPSEVIVTSLIATSVSTIVGLLAVTQLAKLPRYHLINQEEHD
ncbi:MAG: nucleoside recognition domain-containing protein [Legionella sp.]